MRSTVSHTNQIVLKYHKNDILMKTVSSLTHLNMQGALFVCGGECMVSKPGLCGAPKVNPLPALEF